MTVPVDLRTGSGSRTRLLRLRYSLLVRVLDYSPHIRFAPHSFRPHTHFYMWCYLVNEIVIIAVNLDQSPLLLDIHYVTHKLLFGYNNFGSGLFGIALFSWHIYSHSVHCNNKNCSNNIHSHSFVCTNTILLLFVHHTIIGLHLHWFYCIIQ